MTETMVGRRCIVMALLALAMLAASCSKIEAPHVVLNGVDLEGISTDGIEFTLKAEVTNPNGFSANIGKLEYSVRVDGTEVASGMRTKRVPVEAGETVEVGIPFAVTWEALGKGIDQYFDGGDHRWKLTGSAVLSKGAMSRTFTFSESGRFEGPDAGEIDLDF